tara:strand:+ start:1232 stop:1429 length:198 start_codon:yes stop_codon:yes gene_type:complete
MKLKVTLIRDFVFPGKTIKKGTEIEITEDRVPGMVKAGLIEGTEKKEKRKVKTEKASLQNPKIES